MAKQPTPCGFDDVNTYNEALTEWRIANPPEYGGKHQRISAAASAAMMPKMTGEEFAAARAECEAGGTGTGVQQPFIVGPDPEVKPKPAAPPPKNLLPPRQVYVPSRTSLSATVAPRRVAPVPMEAPSAPRVPQGVRMAPTPPPPPPQSVRVVPTPQLPPPPPPPPPQGVRSFTGPRAPTGLRRK